MAADDAGKTWTEENALNCSLAKKWAGPTSEHTTTTDHEIVASLRRQANTTAHHINVVSVLPTWRQGLEAFGWIALGRPARLNQGTRIFRLLDLLC
eukprot:g28197.t1